MKFLFFSQTNKSYHRSFDINKMICQNIERIKRNIKSDYILVGYCLDEEDSDIIFYEIKKNIGNI